MIIEYRAGPGFPGYRVESDRSFWDGWKGGGNDRPGQGLTTMRRLNEDSRESNRTIDSACECPPRKGAV